MNLLKASLPESPIRVGFDVDHTLLFSEPGFSYVRHHLNLNPQNKSILGTYEYAGTI